MPRTNITKLKALISDAGEISAEHRSELLSAISDIEGEIASLPDDHEANEPLRAALAIAHKASDLPADRHHEKPALIEALVDTIESVSISHPVVARFLTTLSRLL